MKTETTFQLPVGSKGLSFNMKQKLDTGLCSGFAKGTVELFPWWDRQRWDTRAAFYFYPNKYCHATISHALVCEMLFLGSCEGAPLPPGTEWYWRLGWPGISVCLRALIYTCGLFSIDLPFTLKCIFVWMLPYSRASTICCLPTFLDP